MSAAAKVQPVFTSLAAVGEAAGVFLGFCFSKQLWKCIQPAGPWAVPWALLPRCRAQLWAHAYPSPVGSSRQGTPPNRCLGRAGGYWALMATPLAYYGPVLEGGELPSVAVKHMRNWGAQHVFTASFCSVHTAEDGSAIGKPWKLNFRGTWVVLGSLMYGFRGGIRFYLDSVGFPW